MRLVDRLRRRGALPEVPLSWGANTTLFEQTYGNRKGEQVQPTFASFAESGFADNGIVFAAELARMSLFSEAKFKFRNLTTKRLFGSDALAPVEDPWPNGGTGDLLTRMIQDVDLAGNFFAVPRPGGGVHRLRPDRVDLVYSPLGVVPDVVAYIYWQDGRGVGEPVVYMVDEVVHWAPVPDPLASYRGMSWLSPVVREVNADNEQTRYKGAYFVNNATPNSIIKYQQRLGDGAVEKIQALWSARYGGVDGWKTAVLDQGADFQVIGSSMEAIRFADVQAAGEARIAAAAGVPPIILGVSAGLDAATYANYEMALRRFADLTMRPLWRSACQALAKFVAVPAGAELWYDTTDIAALSEGEKNKADTMQTLAGAASTLLMSGYTAESITAALTASDLTLLEHSGLLSVQLQPPGAEADGTSLEVAEAIQKVYLGVGTVLTSDEARQIVNQYGAGLVVPGPDLDGTDTDTEEAP